MIFPELKDLVNLKSVLGHRAFARMQTNTRTHGDYSSLFHGLGVEFETVRPYVVGDDVRYIDWRVTARTGEPQIKTFRAECDRNVFVVVDANAYMRFGTRGTFKSVLAARVAALLSWQSLKQQDRVGGLVFGDISGGMQYFKPAKTDSAILTLLKSLCNTQVGQSAPVTISSALHHLSCVVKPQSLVFIISDFSMGHLEELQTELIRLRKQCKVILIALHDPADREIPDIGTIMFDNGQESTLIDTNNMRAKQLYSTAWNAYQASLTHLCKKVKTPILWLETSNDPVKSLFANAGSMLKWKS